jgi:hypothetical protein
MHTVGKLHTWGETLENKGNPYYNGVCQQYHIERFGRGESLLAGKKWSPEPIREHVSASKTRPSQIDGEPPCP